jgi:hypothetical protein
MALRGHTRRLDVLQASCSPLLVKFENAVATAKNEKYRNMERRFRKGKKCCKSWRKPLWDLEEKVLRKREKF